jgi:hypothetical protein
VVDARKPDSNRGEEKPNLTIKEEKDMPETSREIFNDMRITIDHVMLTDWASYISTVTDAYDQAYSRVQDLLEGVKAAVTAREQAEQALMVGVLSVVTGGVVGAFADGLVKRMPAVEKAAASAGSSVANVVKSAEEDPVLYKIFKDTTKDLVKKGADKLQEVGLDQFKGERSTGRFAPEGMRLEDYRDLLTQGIISRGTILWNFADALYKTADDWSAEVADLIRTGLYQNDFFTQKYRAQKALLKRKAELALWCAWALPRDEEYWNMQRVMVNYHHNQEALDWAPVRDELKDLDVPEGEITLAGVQSGFWSAKQVKGLDVIGFMNWVKTVGMVHTLYEGISIAGGQTHHWALDRMKQMIQMVASAA